jgi:hypothetical protein
MRRGDANGKGIGSTPCFLIVPSRFRLMLQVAPENQTVGRIDEAETLHRQKCLGAETSRPVLMGQNGHCVAGDFRRSYKVISTAFLKGQSGD